MGIIRMHVNRVSHQGGSAILASEQILLHGLNTSAPNLGRSSTRAASDWKIMT